MFDLKEGVICPQCEKGKLQVIRKDLSFPYKGQVCKFEKEQVFVCNLCDYEALNWEDTRRIDKGLTDFRRRVDGLLTGEDLQSIRKSMRLNKKKMAKLLSVNEKTIGRYESGKITQSEQVDKLYRVLKKVPGAIRVLDFNNVVCATDAIHTYICESIIAKSSSYVTMEPIIIKSYAFDEAAIKMPQFGITAKVVSSTKNQVITGIDYGEGIKHARAA